MNFQKYSTQNMRKVKDQRKIKNYFYHEQLKPIIVALKLFGALPFTNFEKGPTFISWNTLYSFSVFFITISCVGYFWYMCYKRILEESWLTMHGYLYGLTCLVCSLLTVIIPMFWINIKRINEYWDRWTFFQDKFESYTWMPLQINITRRVWAVTIMPTGFILLNVIITVFTNKPMFISNIFWFIINNALMNLSTGYFYINCYMFREISIDINQRLLDIIWKKKSTTKFKQHVELWCLMSQLMMDFGTVHCGIYILIAIIMYLGSIASLFGIFKIIFSVEKNMIPIFVIWAVFANCMLLVYSESSHLAFSEVQDFLEVLHFFRPNISLGGFCDVNRQFFSNYLMAVCFNIIVAFQLQVVPQRYDIGV